MIEFDVWYEANELELEFIYLIDACEDTSFEDFMDNQYALYLRENV